MRCFRANGGWRKADNALQLTRAQDARPSIDVLSRSRRLNPRRELLHTRPTTTTIYPARQTLALDNTTPRRVPHLLRQTSLAPRRYCSHRRNMCRHFGAEEHGSATIAGAREVLPTNVKPIHYDLTLEPNFEDFTYEGKVVIEYVGRCARRVPSTDLVQPRR
jgi:aminopeptidase 2